MRHLSFKEYLDSKEQLKEAIARSPIQSHVYQITKYCKLAIDIDGKKTEVYLKPKQTISVAWSYRDVHDANPTPITVSFHDTTNMDEIDKYNFAWPANKVGTWIDNNTSGASR